MYSCSSWNRALDFGPAEYGASSSVCGVIGLPLPSGDLAQAEAQAAGDLDRGRGADAREAGPAVDVDDINLSVGCDDRVAAEHLDLHGLGGELGLLGQVLDLEAQAAGGRG